MSEAYIVRRGGGTKIFAAISVTYPAGSTLTCKSGSKTLRAKTTSGRYVFAIPEAGTWTVTATSGTNTISQTVSITTEGQIESVVLSNKYYLFDNGSKVTWRSEATQYSQATIGNTLKCTRASRANEYASVWTSQPVNVTNYSKLGVNVKAVSGSRLLFGLGTTDMSSAISTKAISSTGNLLLDISSVTGNCAVTVNAEYLQQAIAGSVEVTQVWLE